MDQTRPTITRIRRWKSSRGQVVADRRVVVVNPAAADQGATVVAPESSELVGDALIEAVRQRVAANPALGQYADVIFYDWPEGATHYRWLLRATDQQIIEWADSVSGE